jgi:hypothetical protein
MLQRPLLNLSTLQCVRHWCSSLSSGPLQPQSPRLTIALSSISFSENENQLFKHLYVIYSTYLCQQDFLMRCSWQQSIEYIWIKEKIMIWRSLFLKKIKKIFYHNCLVDVLTLDEVCIKFDLEWYWRLICKFQWNENAYIDHHLLLHPTCYLTRWLSSHIEKTVLDKKSRKYMTKEWRILLLKYVSNQSYHCIIASFFVTWK